MENQCLMEDTWLSATKLEKDEIRLGFEKLNYAFSIADGPAIPMGNEYYLIKIQGGPIDVSVVCHQVEVKKYRYYI